jgi:hypothetical protein
MKKANFILMTEIAIIALFVNLAYADTTGTIAGQVLDSETCRPLIGARIMIANTSRGSLVDSIAGNYRLTNIPPGEYALIAECYGYLKEFGNSIIVKNDSITIEDFCLAPDSLISKRLKVTTTAPIFAGYDDFRPIPFSHDTTGTITGYVLDKKTNLAIPGARVQIKGTTIGAMVNPIDGSYVIKNVPPGTDTIIASCIGYNNMPVKNIIIRTGLMTAVNFILTSEAVKVGRVHDSDGPPPIDRFEPRTVKRITGEELRRRPGVSVNLKGLID